MTNIFNNSKDLLQHKKDSKRLIFISSFKENNQLILKIKDNAGGIPEDIMPRIFEPYFTTKHKSQGTGLGLNMTYNLIVDGMHGDIQVHNVEYEFEQAKKKLKEDALVKAFARAEELITDKITEDDQNKLIADYLDKVVA